MDLSITRVCRFHIDLVLKLMRLDNCWHYNPTKMVYNQSKKYCEYKGGALSTIQNDATKQASFRFAYFEESKYSSSDRFLSFWISSESNLLRSAYSATIEVPTRDEVLSFEQDLERHSRRLEASKHPCPYFSFADGAWEFGASSCADESDKRATLCEKKLTNETPAGIYYRKT